MACRQQIKSRGYRDLRDIDLAVSPKMGCTQPRKWRPDLGFLPKHVGREGPVPGGVGAWRTPSLAVCARGGPRPRKRRARVEDLVPEGRLQVYDQWKSTINESTMKQ